LHPIKIYIDEDAVLRALVSALRSHGVSVVTALEAGRIGETDENQLTYAAETGCALFSYNVSDFYRLHTEWIVSGRPHAGLILALQQQWSVGEQLRRILRLRAEIGATEMWNRVEFLSDWR
jgi:hypothetical protein